MDQVCWKYQMQQVALHCVSTGETFLLFFSRNVEICLNRTIAETNDHQCYKGLVGQKVWNNAVNEIVLLSAFFNTLCRAPSSWVTANVTKKIQGNSWNFVHRVIGVPFYLGCSVSLSVTYLHILHRSSTKLFHYTFQWGTLKYFEVLRNFVEVSCNCKIFAWTWHRKRHYAQNPRQYGQVCVIPFNIMHKQVKLNKTCLPLMIPSAWPTVPPLAINHYSHFKFVLFCKILKSGDGRTDIQTLRVKIVITTGRDCESASWINNYSTGQRHLSTDCNTPWSNPEPNLISYMLFIH